MKKKLIILLTIFYCQLSQPGFSQDLWNLVDSAQVPKKEFAYATFKTTRLVNLHTAEVLGKRTLDFRISHRFGAINSGSINAWGLDGPANIRIGLEYSLNGRWMVGIGRSSYEKMDDGFIKYKILRQTTGHGMPISLTFLTSVYYTAQKDANKERNGFDKYRYLSNRFSYVNELLVARKFSNSFSLQLGGWLVHTNLVDHPREKNDAYGASLATRLKFTKRMALAFEYAWRANKNYSESKYYDSMGIGLEIETGGHVFQVHVTNSFGIADNQFLTKTSSRWNNAGIRIGFNISRVFTL
jgi:hypothetical protein